MPATARFSLVSLPPHLTAANTIVNKFHPARKPRSDRSSTPTIGSSPRRRLTER